MNKTRRAALSQITDKLEGLKEELAALQAEEEEALEALPDSFRDGERGEKMESALQDIDEAAGAIEAAIESIHAAVEG